MADNKYCSVRFRTGQELDEALAAALCACDDAAKAEAALSEMRELIARIENVIPPTVGAADDGKIYQVLNGKMSVVAIADSAVKTYIDTYINEALGGEY